MHKKLRFRFSSVLAENRGFGFGLKTVNSPSCPGRCSIIIVFQCGIVNGAFVTDSTRVVYQRKLQRWLQYGPTTDTSTLESSQVEPHVNIPARSKLASADDETSVCSAHSNNVDLGASNGTTTTGSENLKTDDVAVAAAASDLLQKRHISPARMSRSDVVMHARPYSMTFAECGSESFNETGNGWPEHDWLMQKRVEKVKAKTIAGDQPAITQS